MSEKCNQSCSSCGEDCADRKEAKTDFREKPHELSNIKKVIGIVSGKGGVGKSSVTSMLAVKIKEWGITSLFLTRTLPGHLFRRRLE